MDSTGRTRFRQCAAPACGVLLAQCGGGPSAPTTPSGATVTISATGVSPAEVRIPVGSRVTFVNNDARPHAISSDPVQTHTDCPVINDAGFLNPGQSRQTGVLSVARTCGFHDHTDEFNAAFKGRIVVQ